MCHEAMRLHRKLGVSTRSGAMRYALDHQLG